MVLEFYFILTLFVPVFGGQVEVEARTTTLAGCLKLQKVIVAQLEDHRSQFTVQPCSQKPANGG